MTKSGTILFCLFNFRDLDAKLLTLNQQLPNVEEEKKQIQLNLRSLRREQKDAHASAIEARTSRDRAQMKREEWEDKLGALQPSDNTKITVLEAALEVRCSKSCANV